MAPTSLSTTQQEAIRAISKAPLVFNAGIYLVNNGEKESDTLGGGMFIEARSPFYLTQLCIGRTIMQHGEELYMLKILVPVIHMYQKKIASFNSLARICPVVLMSNLFSRTTLLMMQEMCYMVVQ